MLEAKCHGGHLTFDGQSITISRKGVTNFLVHGFAGEKTIPIGSITAVQLRKPGMLTAGYIQFTVKGGRESVGGLMEASKDENSVLFTSDLFNAVDRIRIAVMDKVANMSAPSVGTRSDADE